MVKEMGTKESQKRQEDYDLAMERQAKPVGLEKNKEATEAPCYSGLSLLRRINEIRGEVEYVRKDEAKGLGYSVLSHDAVTAFTRNPMIKWGVVQIPSVKEVHFLEPQGKIVHVVMEVVFECVDMPSRIAVRYDALGMDKHDKALPKAISMATKYAVLKVLNLETGEDEESRVDISSQAPVGDESAAWIREALSGLGRDVEAFVGWYNGRHGPNHGEIQTPEEIPKKVYPQVRQQINIWKEHAK